MAAELNNGSTNNMERSHGEELRDLGKTTEMTQDPSDPENAPVKWSHSWNFTFSSLGYTIGFGNVLRFPYLAYKNGGGSFLIPYAIMLFLVGLPLFFIEIIIGQYNYKGPTRAFKKIAPITKGIGYAMVFITCSIGVCFNVLIAWAIRYWFSGMATEIPWLNKETNWSTDYENWTTVVYFNKTIGLGDGSINSSQFLGMNWEIVGCLFASCSVVCACCIFGVRYIGRALYFTVPYPYVVLVIMFIWSLTLEGSGEGILYFLVPADPMQLLDPYTWSVAASQVLYSLSIGAGGLTSLSMHNDFNTDCLKTSMIICLVDSLTSIFAGFIIFAVLGNISHSLHNGSASREEFDLMMRHNETRGYWEGPGLAYIAYPMTLQGTSPGVPQLWSFLFFLMLIALGLDNTFVFVDTISTAIEENFKCVRRNNRDFSQKMQFSDASLNLPKLIHKIILLSKFPSYGFNITEIIIQAHAGGRHHLHYEFHTGPFHGD